MKSVRRSTKGYLVLANLRSIHLTIGNTTLDSTGPAQSLTRAPRKLGGLMGAWYMHA